MCGSLLWSSLLTSTVVKGRFKRTETCCLASNYLNNNINNVHLKVLDPGLNKCVLKHFSFLIFASERSHLNLQYPNAK